jgi:hypothetical protein
MYHPKVKGDDTAFPIRDSIEMDKEQEGEQWDRFNSRRDRLCSHEKAVYHDASTGFHKIQYDAIQERELQM